MSGASETPAATYVVGIDLGTTNSAVAFARIADARRQGPRAVRSFAVAQLTGQSVVEARPLIPSALYLPPPGEVIGALPFATQDVVGVFAREMGARVAGRLVVSAKSWLCHGGVDRRSAILPPAAPADVPRLSPVEASARILAHLRAAWDAEHTDAPLAGQDVVLAVPASFDAVARSLTVEAARAAGLDRFTLVEEPQAAFYDYHAAHEAAGGESPDRLVLVVDVGGGTSDFTLIKVSRDGETPVLVRLAVGDHILLGGDNMDMALARRCEERLGQKLEPSRWALLVEACRSAKETLLSGAEAPNAVRIVVPSRGSKLFGGSLSTELTRAEVEAVLVDGFFPVVSVDARPQRAVRSGLAQLGLPYEHDPGLSRHIAAFLARHDGARPDAVLLNGGVFNSPRLRERLFEVLTGLGLSPELLPHGSLDLSVARGAAAYGLVRMGLGTRIGGGSPRAYYVEVAAPLGEQGRRAICLIPKGHDSVDPIVLASRTFQLRVGRPVEFKIFTSSGARTDASGDLISWSAGKSAVPGSGGAAALDVDFEVLPVVQTLLPSDGRAEIPVLLSATLDDTGVLDLACLAVDRDKRWRLEFDLRGTNPVPAFVDDGDAAPRAGRMGLSPAQEQRAAEAIERIFGKATTGDVKAKDVRQLRESLRVALCLPREEWTLPMLRALWELLAPHVKRRRRTADHEAVFLNLAGYFLRPGFGYPMDEWRIKELWQLFAQDVQYHQDDAVWHAWWVLWRRIVGGLDAAQQKQLLGAVRVWLRPTEAENRANAKAKRQLKGQEEMLRLVGSLERLDPMTKADWGEWLLAEIEAGRASSTAVWTFARLGARAPFSSTATNVVDSERVELWLERLMALNWSKLENAAFAAAHLARRTDDRLRDVSDECREKVLARLERERAQDLAPVVRDALPLEALDESKFVGDALPPGLVLG